MKSHTTAALRRSTHQGFTLLELLVVMIIIGILAALTLGVFRYAQESAARNRTVGTHAAIQAALAQYKEKHGEFPEPANPAEEDSFAGNTMRIGGAHMLYQAITGDGNSAIRLAGGTTEGGSESDGKVEGAEIDYRVNVGSALPKSVIYPPRIPVGTTRARMLVDGWSRPFQYTKANPDPAISTTVNSTYDLWSFGPMTNAVAPVDSLEAKRDPGTSSAWIKNW